MCDIFLVSFGCKDGSQTRFGSERVYFDIGQFEIFIQKNCRSIEVRNIVVSQKAVSNLIRKNINKEAGSDTAPSLVKPRGSPKLRTPGLVAAIEKDLSGPNPLTRSALSFKYGVSATTIARVIS